MMVEYDRMYPEYGFASNKGYGSAEHIAALKEAGIYVRYFNKPRINNHLRITIGTDEEMEVLYACLRKYLNR